MADISSQDDCEHFLSLNKKSAFFSHPLLTLQIAVEERGCQRDLSGFFFFFIVILPKRLTCRWDAHTHTRRWVKRAIAMSCDAPLSLSLSRSLTRTSTRTHTHTHASHARILLFFSWSSCLWGTWSLSSWPSSFVFFCDRSLLSHLHIFSYRQVVTERERKSFFQRKLFFQAIDKKWPRSK